MQKRLRLFRLIFLKVKKSDIADSLAQLGMLPLRSINSFPDFQSFFEK